MQIQSRSSLRSFEGRLAKKTYVFLVPVKIPWTDGDGPKRWTNENADRMLPPAYYRMTVVADRKGTHDFDSPSYGKYLIVEWLDESPDGDISLDSILQRAAAVVEYSKYAE